MDGNSGVDDRACCLYVEMPFVGQQSSDPNLAPKLFEGRTGRCEAAIWISTFRG